MTNHTSIFSQLESEHKQVKNLLKRAEEARPSDRSEALEKIKEHLIPHARAEEKTLYSTLLEENVSSELEDLVKEAYAEHETADSLLKEVSQLDVEDEMWKAKMMVLKENVEHHIREEENKFFPRAKKLISQDISRDMLEVYKKEKKLFKESKPTQSQIDATKRSSDLADMHL